MSKPVRETGLVYTKRPKEPGSKSYREIAEELGDISYVSVANILNGAFRKVAREVFLGLNGREPTRIELNNLARNEAFQLMVAEMLSEKK